MISVLAKLFIPDYKSFSSPKVRKAYGTLCSASGIVLNILLFIIKFMAGALSGAISVMADAFNNLSDAGSSLVTLLGFRLGGKKPDTDHPFGHGRIEYISGLVVSFLILLMGFELFKSSLIKIINPAPVVSSPFALTILIISIIIKIYMAIYNKLIGKRIHSPAMLATSADSLSDCIATLATLISLLLVRFFNINIDGYAGILVALFIFYAGYSAMKEVLGPILGQAPDPRLVQEIIEIIMESPVSKGIHDLMVHDYGPGRLFISVHVEVDGKEDIYFLHNAIDIIEKNLESALDCAAVIHMDPLKADDEETKQLRQQVMEVTRQKVDNRIEIHDFRVVPGKSHTNIIFDAFVPLDSDKSSKELTEEITDAVLGINPEFHCIIKINKR